MYNKKIITVIIPALNEEKTIGDVIKKIPDFADNILVIDDGSIDKTCEIATSLNAIVVSHKINLGVGAAFNSGVKKALELNTDIMINLDADGQFDPKDIIKLIEPINNNEADFVTASRFKDPLLYPEMTLIKFYGNHLMSYLVSKVCNKKFYDVSCGFRAYSKKTLFKLNLFGQFTYTQETFIDLAHKNLRIKEIPLKIIGIRKHGKSRVASNLFKYSYRTFNIILKSFRDYNPFKLFFFIGSIFIILGINFGLFLLIYYMNVGNFSPHKWAGFLSSFFIMIAFLSYGLGFIMDSFARMRMNQEELLYQIKHLKDNIDE